MFSRFANRIRSALSEQVLLLEHVGSTSVPGLSAKPIVDMLLAVQDSAVEMPGNAQALAELLHVWGVQRVPL